MRDKIVKFCQDYLKVNEFKDYCHNGLQVEGTENVKKIITGVSLSQRLINETIKKRTQMLMVHHGLFNRQIKPLDGHVEIKGIIKNRIKSLLENDINLCGFHLPLDAHPVIGNNISLCKLLGIKKLKPMYVGFVGELDKKVKFNDFLESVNEKLGVRSYFISAGPAIIKKIGVISGGAAEDFKLAAELGADTYICGEIREEYVREIEETGINFINAGHYNTEKLGIQNLGKLVTKKFGIDVEFVDVPCGI